MSTITEPTNNEGDAARSSREQKGGGDVIQLWSAEIDAMRDEARQVVAAAMAAMADEMQAMGTPPTDRQARVQLYRDWQASGYHPVPEAEVQGVRRSAVPGVPA